MFSLLFGKKSPVRPNRQHLRRPSAFRPAVELLEDRQLLTAVTAIAPSGVIASATPIFRWNALASADHYEVWVDDQTTNTSAVLRNEAVVGTSWTTTDALQPGDTYRWWVRGIDASNSFASDWSAPLDFKIAALA